ncbi:MAG: cytochrome c biogenesis protein CcsA [Bacteroidetes bacterium]|nr:cytochrome c biogenesis protein CcsA [Bacteroidota bacterium]
MEFLGEHLLPGKFGHLFVVLSFVASLLAAVSYYFATLRRETVEGRQWLSMGRFSFLLHGLAVLGIIGTLFYILVGKMYEYEYAWANISDDLPTRYVFSAFWKEQQGSFLLWSFWHIGLGLVLMFRAGKWEAPVLTVVAFAEAFIASMILGLYFGDYRLGASPFDLLRDTMNAPIFQMPDYLSKIKGNGLNPLLQNYWMTIHPPTLFLGFASTIVPFSYAVAGLWLREHKEWLKPALQWALFSGAILGTGILMGGAWAYEALSFGGYWAWDPVENTSLVPWLVLVAGIHTNLVARATGYSTRSTYAFYLLSFILVLYSTYLTRSGILGDTSAHAFTEMGLSVQLVAFIAAFTILAGWLWGSRYKGVPEAKPEESIVSREFWMFIGALVLFFSSVLITGATSLPVYNKIMVYFNPKFTGAALEDPMTHHNRYQIWIAVFIGVLSGYAQWLRYNERNWVTYRKKLSIHLFIALVLGGLLSYLNGLWVKMDAWQHYVLMFSAMFTLVANVDYLVWVLKGNLRLAGSAVSHFGFAVLILGIMSTGLGKAWISSNTFAMEGLIEGMGDQQEQKNILLLKDAPMPIKEGYEATYLKDTVVRQTRTFDVLFKHRDENGNDTGESFTLRPNVMYDRQFSKVVASNPSTKHYWAYDIFTHVSSLPKAELDPEFAKKQEDSLRYTPFRAKVGDTIFTQKHFLILEDYTKSPAHHEYVPEPGDLAFGLKFSVHSKEKTKVYTAAPMMCFRPGKGVFALSDEVSQAAMKLRLTKETMDHIFETEESLKYQKIDLKAGETKSFGDNQITLVKLSREAPTQGYVPEPEDIVVSAQVMVKGADGKTFEAKPVYLIRKNQPIGLQDEIPQLGLHLRFEKIDPQTGTISLAVAQANRQQQAIPFELAENSSRSDYIVLEAIVFPGINLVWIGSISMLIGLAISFWRRTLDRKYKSA